VVPRPSSQLLEPRELVFRGCDHQLARDPMWDALLFAERKHLVATLAAGDGFERARCIVEARVENARVVTTLMETHRRFFFDHGDPKALLSQLERGGQANDSSPTDNYIGRGHGASGGLSAPRALERWQRCCSSRCAKLRARGISWHRPGS